MHKDTIHASGKKPIGTFYGQYLQHKAQTRKASLGGFFVKSIAHKHMLHIVITSFKHAHFSAWSLLIFRLQLATANTKWWTVKTTPASINRCC